MTTNETQTLPTPAFPEHLRSALQGLRASLIELLASVGANPTKPQELARRFGLNKNLTWRISKIVGETNLYSSVPHIPGASGLEIFFRAMEKADAPADLITATRGAVREFDRVVEVHTGDRSTLEIMIGGMLPTTQQGEQSRKLAYQGNSSTWGARAKAQLAMNILIPNADDPDMVDVGQVGGLVGFRRLRPGARWLLFRREHWNDDDHQVPGDVVSFDPAYPANEGVPLISRFCSEPIPDIERWQNDGEVQYELPPGAVGNTASTTCIYGEVSRRVGPAYADGPGEMSEIGTNLITPAEHLVLDLLVHRSFTWAMAPDFIIYSRMDGGAMNSSARRSRNLLPVTEPVQDLGWGVNALATPLLPRYRQLATYAFDRLQLDADEFRAFRVTMSYPPIPAAALLCSELPVR